MFFYCKTNDILIQARSLKDARKYAEYRLSPAYGHDPNRADNLNLKRVSAEHAERLSGGSIIWEID